MENAETASSEIAALQVNDAAQEEETGKWSFWKAVTKGKVRD